MLSSSEIERISRLSRSHHGLLLETGNLIKPGMDGYKLLSFLESRMQTVLPAAVIASFDVNINESICHTLPQNSLFRDEDIITLDLVLQEGGVFSDGAWTFICGEQSPESREFVRKAWEVSLKAFRAIIRDRTSLDMKKTVHNALVGTSYTLIEDACGHGIGKSIHESPDISYSLANQDDILWKKGMVFTVEPVIAMSGAKLFQHKEKGFITDNLSPSAYFEHMVSIDENGVHCLNIPQINDMDSIDIFSQII